MVVDDTWRVRAADRLVNRLGGRFSRELGIELDDDPDGSQVDRWFLAATLFRARIPWVVAELSYRALAGSGVRGLSDVVDRDNDELVDLLDEGGYARYDDLTEKRLRALGAMVRDRFGSVVSLRRIADPGDLESVLCALPGWGPATAGVFLRELRGLWPGAGVPVDLRAVAAAHHLDLVDLRDDPLEDLVELAPEVGADPRDLECALVRLDLGHGRRFESCPGGPDCEVLG